MTRVARARAQCIATLVVALAALGGWSNSAAAQRGGRGKVPIEERGRADQAPDNDRVALQRQIRQAFAQRVRKQLNLNDEQMRNLQQVNRKYDQQRRELVRTERESRVGLRTAMADTSGSEKARQAKVSQYMDQIVQAQHSRAELLANEQKELGGFLTPVQRAQFSAMRDQFNRRLQEVQQDSTGSGGGRRGAPPPEP